MSDALLGVIVGGAIANIGIIISLIFEYLKWKREKKVEYLQKKRERLEILLKSLDERITKALFSEGEALFPRDLVVDIFHACPKNVSDAFMELVEATHKSFPTVNDIINTVGDKYDRLLASMRVAL